jgi:hypothetical protein
VPHLEHLGPGGYRTRGPLGSGKGAHSQGPVQQVVMESYMPPAIRIRVIIAH